MNLSILMQYLFIYFAFTSNVLTGFYNSYVPDENKIPKENKIYKFCLRILCNVLVDLDVKLEPDCKYICPAPCRCLSNFQHPCICCRCPGASPSPNIVRGTSPTSVYPHPHSPPQVPCTCPPSRPKCTCTSTQTACVCNPPTACRCSSLETTARVAAPVLKPSIKTQKPPNCASPPPLSIPSPQCVCPSNQTLCSCPAEPLCPCPTQNRQPTREAPVTSPSKTTKAQQPPVDCTCLPSPPQCECSQANCSCLPLPTSSQCGCSPKLSLCVFPTQPLCNYSKISKPTSRRPLPVTQITKSNVVIIPTSLLIVFPQSSRFSMMTTKSTSILPHTTRKLQTIPIQWTLPSILPIPVIPMSSNTRIIPATIIRTQSMLTITHPRSRQFVFRLPSKATSKSSPIKSTSESRLPFSQTVTVLSPSLVTLPPRKTLQTTKKIPVLTMALKTSLSFASPKPSISSSPSSSSPTPSRLSLPIPRSSPTLSRSSSQIPSRSPLSTPSESSSPTPSRSPSLSPSRSASTTPSRSSSLILKPSPSSSRSSPSPPPLSLTLSLSSLQQTQSLPFFPSQIHSTTSVVPTTVQPSTTSTLPTKYKPVPPYWPKKIEIVRNPSLWKISSNCNNLAICKKER